MRKNERFITLIGGVDQKYVIEAENKIKLKKKKRSERLKGLVIAASVAIVISAVSAWLFIPFSTTPKSVAAYKDSEYYELIEKINDFTFSVPEHKILSSWLRWHQGERLLFLSATLLLSSWTP